MGTSPAIGIYLAVLIGLYVGLHRFGIINTKRGLLVDHIVGGMLRVVFHRSGTTHAE